MKKVTFYIKKLTRLLINLLEEVATYIYAIRCKFSNFANGKNFIDQLIPLSVLIVRQKISHMASSYEIPWLG